MAFTYEASKYSVNWTVVDLSDGWGEDTWLQITPSAPRVEVTMGADGKATYSKNSNRSATITMTFTQAAEDTLKEIYKIYAAQDKIGADLEIAPFWVKDESESGLDSILFLCRNAVLTEVPENTFARTATERTITWHTETYILSDDVSTALAELSDYIK